MTGMRVTALPHPCHPEAQSAEGSLWNAVLWIAGDGANSTTRPPCI